MSGGSYNYACFKVEEMADGLRNRLSDSRREAFAKLLKLVSRAMHDIEWVDSCDYGDGDDHEAIDAVFSFLKADSSVIRKAAAFDGLKETLERYFK